MTVKGLPPAVALALALALAGGGVALAQPGALPPLPVLPPGDRGAAAPQPPMLGRPEPLVPPGAPPCPPPGPSPFAPGPGPSAGPYDPLCQPEGYFFDVEFDLVGPAVKNRLQAPVTRPDGSVVNGHVPSADLDWTAMPRFEVGVRLPDRAGSFSFAYRFLISEGTGQDAASGGGLRSRLNVNIFDFDYATAVFEPLPRLEWKWFVGARLSTNFYDSRLAGDGFEQRASNYFVGAGPHGGFEVDRNLAFLPGFALMGRVDGAVQVGRSRQRYVNDLTAADGSAFDAEETQRKTLTVPSVELQAGLRYRPPDMEFLSLSAGYVFERWFDVGRVNDARLEMTTQGIFLRGEINY